MSGDGPNELAIAYLLAARTGGAEANAIERRLARLDDRQLALDLDSDTARVAFWLDVYNAAVVRAGAVALTARRTRWQHFRQRSLVVAGHRLSLDGIEHGLLRRSRWKLALGYLGNPLPGTFERRHRVGRLDPRVHFALNCGAASCPPITAYEAERLDEQLELATRSFLTSEVRRDGDVLRIPPVLLWYIGDFGGPRGVRRLLVRSGVEDASLPLRFSKYDWSPAPDRWTGDAG